MDLSFQVLKEPRGLIRLIQAILAIIAFALTVGFSTDCEFNIPCKASKDSHIQVEYEIEYPFSDTSISAPQNCVDENDKFEIELPFDFSNGAEFFVATGVLAFLYCVFILVVYIGFHQTYAQNNKLPVIDLGISTVLTIFWLAGSSAWSQGVADLKYYLHPDTVFKLLPVCVRPGIEYMCHTVEDGSYGTLNASLVLGFANFLLWACSLWFVYKETVFFAEPVPEPTQNQQAKVAGRV